MSEENVEVVRRVYKLAEARGVEGLLELATDDIVWVSDPRFPGGGRQTGKENVRRWLKQLWIYDEVSIEVEGIIDLDDMALGITNWHGISADAPPVDWPWCHLFAFRDGLISQARSFLDRSEALEAAGLSEEATSEKNVEIVRRAFAYEYYGIGGRAEAEAIFDPHVVMNPTDEGPSEGMDAMRADYERWASAWEDLRVTVEEIIDAGDQVLLVVHHQGRGRKSGVRVETRFYPVYTLREGKVSRVDEFDEIAEALEAAGLSK